MSGKTITVNRAPVLTLWATVVAERLGYDWDTALTLGKAVAGYTAQAKGRTLGIYQPAKDKPDKKPKRGEEFFVELCGRSIPAKTTDDGIRAVSKDKELDPESVERYLVKAFGEDLEDVTAAMRHLAESLSKDELNGRAFGLYERFRPSIASGTRGWGQKVALDVDGIRALASIHEL